MKWSEIVSNNSLMFLISLFSLILGILGGIGIIFTIKSYYAQKRTEHAFEKILNDANQDYKGNYTETEVEKLNNRLHDLTTEINNDIPRIAYKALLEFKEEYLRIELESLYNNYCLVKKELKEIDVTAKLSPEIEVAVSKVINKKIRGHRISNKLLIFIVIMLFFSTPSVYNVCNGLTDYLIWLTGAHISVSLLSFYIMCLFVGILLFSSIPFQRTALWSRKNRKKGILLMVVLLLLWIIICYIITYDILIPTFEMQIILGFVSILVFSYALVIFKHLMQK